YLDSATLTEVETLYTNTRNTLDTAPLNCERMSRQQASHPLADNITRMSTQTEIVLEAVNEQLIEAYADKMTWQEFNRMASDNMEALRLTEQHIIERALGTVQQRLADKENNRIGLI